MFFFEKNFFSNFIPKTKMYAPSDKKYAFKKLKYFPSAPQLACEIHQILT